MSFMQKNYASIPITVKVVFESLNGRVRLFLSKNPQIKNWYAFVGRPALRFWLDPVLGKDNKFSVNMIPKLTSFL